MYCKFFKCCLILKTWQWINSKDYLTLQVQRISFLAGLFLRNNENGTFKLSLFYFKFSLRILGFLSKKNNRAPPTVIGVMFVWLSFTQSEIECLY